VGAFLEKKIFTYRISWKSFLWELFWRKNLHMSNFMEILPVGAELFYADRQMDG
jgi:hypothetical protein